MAAVADRNLRSGNLNEELGTLVLSSFCAVAPVPRPHDIGIDVVGTLLRPDGNRRLLAERSFYVQIKSYSVEALEFLDDEYTWLGQLELPYFVARASAKDGVVEIFSTAMTKHHLLEDQYRGVVFTFGEPPKEVVRDRVRLLSLGEPVIRFDVRELTDRERLDRCYEIMKVILEVEAENTRLLRIRRLNQLKWVANEVPTRNGWMRLVSGPGAKNWEQDVVDELVEILMAGLWAFRRSPEALDAALQLLEHAHSQGRLSEDDQKCVSFAVHIIESRRKSTSG